LIAINPGALILLGCLHFFDVTRSRKINQVSQVGQSADAGQSWSSVDGAVASAIMQAGMLGYNSHK
jgi:hypothetical protein